MISFFGGPNGAQGIQGLQGEKGDPFQIGETHIDYTIVAEENVEEKVEALGIINKEKYNSTLGTFCGVYLAGLAAPSLYIFQYKDAELVGFKLGILTQPYWYTVENGELIKTEEKIYFTKENNISNLVEGQLNFDITNDRLKISSKNGSYTSPLPYKQDPVNGYLTADDVVMDQVGDIKPRALEDTGVLLGSGNWVMLPYSFVEVKKTDYPEFAVDYCKTANSGKSVKNIDFRGSFSSYYYTGLTSVDYFSGKEYNDKYYFGITYVYNGTHQVYFKIEGTSVKEVEASEALTRKLGQNIEDNTYFENSDKIYFQFADGSKIAIAKTTDYKVSNLSANYAFLSDLTGKVSYIIDKSKKTAKNINLSSIIVGYEYQNGLYCLADRGLYKINTFTLALTKIKDLSSSALDKLAYTKIASAGNIYVKDNYLLADEYVVDLPDMTNRTTFNYLGEGSYAKHTDGIAFEINNAGKIKIADMTADLPITYTFTIDKQTDAPYEYLKIR